MYMSTHLFQYVGECRRNEEIVKKNGNGKMEMQNSRR